MATATQKESMTADIEADYLAECEIADQLLFEIAAEERRPTGAEYAYFLRNLGWGEIPTKEQYRRVSQARNLMAIAGKPQDREAAALEAATAAKILESEGAKIADQIEKLQAKLNGFERDARLSSKRLEEQAAAVEGLRKLVPDHIRKRIARAISELHQAEGVGVQAVHDRARVLASCLNAENFLSQGAMDAYQQHVKRFYPDAVVIREHGRMLSYHFTSQWAGIKASIEAELGELQETLPPMQAAYDAKVAHIKMGLNHYANGVTE